MDTQDRASLSTDFHDLPMRVGVGQFRVPTDEMLTYVRQLGVEDVQLNLYNYEPDEPGQPIDGEDEWSYENLVALRERVESYGLRLNAIENVPIRFYEDVMLGRAGRDEQLEHMKSTIRNLGRAGIPMFGYHWAPAGVWRNVETKVRGGDRLTGFDMAAVDDSLTHGREYTEAELWEYYEYFLQEVLPVAEDAGVKLSLHPSDPPVESIGGVPQLFRNHENFRRAMDLVPSDHHGLDLCLGCWSEMGEDLEAVIRDFGERDELFYVHFRDVEGTVPSFHETYVDEGNYDAIAIMRLLREVGFSGMLIPDHAPNLLDDTDWQHRGRALTVGYLRGIVETLADCDADAENGY